MWTFHTFTKYCHEIDWHAKKFWCNSSKVLNLAFLARFWATVVDLKYRMNVSYLHGGGEDGCRIALKKFEANISKNVEDMAKRRLQSQITVCWRGPIRYMWYCLHTVEADSQKAKASFSPHLVNTWSMQQGMFNFTETFAIVIRTRWKLIW